MKNAPFFSSPAIFSRSFLLFTLFFTFFIRNAESAIINVPADAPTIQGGINLAGPSGDTVQIAAGTYVEEIQVINKSLNIIGAGQNSTIIRSPDLLTHLAQNFTFGVNFWCVVMIDNQAAPAPQTVNISNLTVDGDTQQDTIIPPIYGNSDRFFAIGYHNANGTVQNVHTTNTRQTANFNQLAGGGIINASNNGLVTFNVNNCLVDFYQRLGIDCRGTTLTANLSNNTVNRGYVLAPNTATATPNGIQFSGSATGSITNNIVESNISTVLGAQATGILPFGAGPNLVVSGNTANNNDLGIVAINCDNNLNISNNTINFTTTPGVNIDEGIVVQDTNGLTTLTSNIMNNIPDINMELISTANEPFQLSGNQFIGSQTGLIVTGNNITGPVVTMNGDAFTGTVGYYIQEVTSPNNLWPSTATVSFDGLYSGHITLAEYNQIQSKLFGMLDDPSLGLILEYIVPAPPVLTDISPTLGSPQGGNTVTVFGSSFISSNTQVFFGSVPGTNVVIVSDNELTVTVPAGTGTVEVTVITPFGTTPIVSSDRYTYLSDVTPNLLPPTRFIGIVKENRFLNTTEYILRATWDASPSPDVTEYRIYRKGHLVDKVPAGSRLVFVTYIRWKNSAKEYRITAVNGDNLESKTVPIRIIRRSSGY